MNIAITGGTGFIGRHLARELAAEGHTVTLIARGQDRTDPATWRLPRARIVQSSIDDPARLAEAFRGCDAVAHCAGINRELGRQTFQRVHVEGTRQVIEAARGAGVRKVALMSFLRARPGCGSMYHESKWAAEEIVRGSGLDYTVFKSGVVYGRGDHMLDHLSHAFHTFPVFAFVGFKDRPIRPTAVEDLVRLLRASLVEGALSRKTVAVVGPDDLTLCQVVRKVAEVVGRRPVMFPLPVWFHFCLGALVERVMVVPMVSVAQVRMLAEGIAEAAPACELPPSGLAPRIRFTATQIKKGLPEPKPFGRSDLLCCRREKKGAAA